MQLTFNGIMQHLTYDEAVRAFESTGDNPNAIVLLDRIRELESALMKIQLLSEDVTIDAADSCDKISKVCWNIPHIVY